MIHLRRLSMELKGVGLQRPKGGAPSFAHRETCRGRDARVLDLKREAFDPFGWKGAFKDTVEGLMDGKAPID